MANKHIRNFAGFKVWVVIITLCVVNLLIFSDLVFSYEKSASEFKQNERTELQEKKSTFDDEAEKKTVNKALENLKTDATALRAQIGQWDAMRGGILGDVDGDGRITDNDANLIGDFLVAKVDSLPHAELADVDWDGAITIIDAMFIAQTVTMGDRMPPGITHIWPRDNSRDVPVDTFIVVSLSEPIEATSIDSSSFFCYKDILSSDSLQTIKGNINILPGDTTIAFKPDHSLDYGQKYSIVMAKVQDKAGNKLRQSGFATFRTQASPALGPVGTVSGIVLDEDDTPIKGVTIRILNAIEKTDFGVTKGKNFYLSNSSYNSVPIDTTDDFGRFLIEDIPEGKVKLLVDGRTVKSEYAYPPTTYLLDAVANQDNSLRRPIYLQRMDLGHMVSLKSDSTTIITSPSVPGFSLVVQPGSAKFADGTPCDALGVTSIPKKTEPCNPPPGYAFDKCYRLYPTGVYFDPPAKATYPAPEGMIPGTKIDLAEYDYDACKYIITGKLTVNSNSTLLESDPGVGLLWTCCHNPIYWAINGNVNWKLVGCLAITSIIPALDEILDVLLIAQAVAKTPTKIVPKSWLKTGAKYLLGNASKIKQFYDTVTTGLALAGVVLDFSGWLDDKLNESADYLADQCIGAFGGGGNETIEFNSIGFESGGIVGRALQIIDEMHQELQKLHENLVTFENSLLRIKEILEQQEIDENALQQEFDLIIPLEETINQNLYCLMDYYQQLKLAIRPLQTATSQTVSTTSVCDVNQPSPSISAGIQALGIGNVNAIPQGMSGLGGVFASVSAGLQQGITGADGMGLISGVPFCVFYCENALGQGCNFQLIWSNNISLNFNYGNLGTLPSFDSDKDGMPDDWERNNGLNPADSTDSFTDADNDTLTNVMEYLSFLDPQNSDTDGDGVGDYREVLGGYTYNYEVPVEQPRIFTLSPSDGAPGDSILITGEGFGDSTSTISVSFNGISAGIGKRTSTTIMTAVPEGVRSGPVYVAVDGKVSTSQMFYLDTTAGSFENITAVDSLIYVVDGSGVAGLQIFTVSDPNNPRLLGACDIPGYPVGIQVKEDKAYIIKAAKNSTWQSPGDENGLTIVDISDPFNPFVLGSTTIKYYDSHNGRWNWAPIYDFEVVDDKAYVVYDAVEQMERFGLSVIDVSSSSNPAVIETIPIPLSGSWGAFGSALALQSNLAYVGFTERGFIQSYPNQLSIADITSDPLKPEVVGTTLLPASPRKIALRGDYAYVANGTAGLSIVDVTNPHSPEVLTTVRSKHIAQDLSLVGDRAYVADCDSGVTVYDISNPTAPVLLNTYNTPGQASGIVVVGNYLYVSDGSSGLQHFTLQSEVDTDPPQVLSISPNAGESAEINAPITVCFSEVIDASTITATSFDVRVEGNLIPGQFTVSEEYVTFVPASPFFPALKTVDVTITSNVKDLAGNSISRPFSSSFTTKFIYAVAGNLTLDNAVKDVFVKNNLAFLAASESGLLIYDITNHLAPAYVGSLPSIGNVQSVKVFDDIAYLSVKGNMYDQNNGLRLVDVSIPTNPTALGLVTQQAHDQYNGWTWIGAADVDLINNTAFVALANGIGDGNPNFLVVNVSDPNNPKILKGMRIPVSGTSFSLSKGVEICGRYAYVLSGHQPHYLCILDVTTDPLNPKFVSSLALPGTNFPELRRGIDFSGNYAFIATGDAGITVIDLSNSAAPFIVTNVLTTGQKAEELFVMGDSLYVADPNLGLEVYNIVDPTNPVFVGNVYTPGDPVGITVVGSTAYLADSQSGLQIIPVLPAEDRQLPSVARICPVDGTNAPANSPITVRFSEMIDPMTIYTSTFKVSVEGSAIVGRYTVEGKKATFIPQYPYPSNKTVNIILTTGIRDVAGNTLASPFSSSFTSEFVSTIVNTIDLPNEANAVFVRNDTLYVGCDNSFRIYDVHDMHSPVLLGSLDNLGIIRCIEVVGKYAYVGQFGKSPEPDHDLRNGLAIIDISNPASPQWVGWWTEAGPYWDQWYVGMYDLKVVGNYLYAVCRASGSSSSNFLVLDIADPLAPTLLKGAKPFAGYEAVGLDIHGTIAYVTGRGEGNYNYLGTIDITDPLNPQAVGSVRISSDSYFGGECFGVEIVGDYAYIANRDSGLTIVKVSDAALPVKMTSVGTNGHACDVSVRGDSVYVVDANASLFGYDVSNPNSPVLIGEVHTPGQSRSLAIEEYLVYIADGTGGIQIIVLKP